MLHLVSLLLLALPSSSLPSTGPVQRRADVGGPNSTIAWTLCPDTANDARNTTYYCSTFQTPLNWLEPVEGQNADLFIRMYPADEGKRVGSLMVEAGGPGGSSSNFVLLEGAYINYISGGIYDIVGHDPRGVNLTYPNMRSFDSDYLDAIFSTANPPLITEFDPSVPFTPSSDPEQYKVANESFNYMDRRADLQYDLLINRTTVDERKSISTAFFARDIAALVDALGEPDGLLTYYGPSYGTVVGATFAGMFPEKVGRMALDGVVYSPDYLNDVSQFLIDSGMGSVDAEREFARLCAQSGPVRCALAPANSTDVEEGAAVVTAKVFAVFHQLLVSPLPVPKDADGFSSFLEVEDAYFIFLSALYAPINWQIAAQAFALALEGDGSLLRALRPIDPVIVRGDRSLANENVFNRTTGSEYGNAEALFCSDQSDEHGWEGLRNGTNDAWVALLEKIQQNDFGGANSLVQLAHPCRTYKDGAFERYGGPFSVAEGLRPLKNKVLFVGSTYDPITPVRSARRMAANFGEENASLLISDGRGHTTLTSPPGSQNCTEETIRAYFVNGTLPEFGKVCPTDQEAVFPEPVDGAVDPMLYRRDAVKAFREQVGRDEGLRWKGSL